MSSLTNGAFLLATRSSPIRFGSFLLVIEFKCKTCSTMARIEELTKGIQIVGCKHCEIYELWDEQLVDLYSFETTEIDVLPTRPPGFVPTTLQC